MRRIVVPAAWAVAALVVVGCGQEQRPLPGCVFAASVLVYPHAQLGDDAMGGTYYDDQGNPVSETMTWFFEVKEPKAKVAEFYRSRWKGAQESVDEEGNVVFTLAPAGAEPGESITVRVAEGKLRITEEVKPGKRRDDL